MQTLYTPLWQREGRTPSQLLSDLVEDLFQGNAARSEPTPPTTFRPPLDLLETEEGYLVRLDLPGVSREDLDVELADGVLRVRGQRAALDEAGEALTHRLERRTGAFERAIRFDRPLDGNRLEASLQNGVLEVRLPKVNAAKAQKIDIRAL